MKSYNNEIVLQRTEARLVPPNQNYPDCICKLLLTENHFYALEDNYNGSFTEHMKIPRQQIKQVEQFTYHPKTGKRTKATDGSASDLPMFGLGLLGGLLVLSGGNNSKGQYLEIGYLDDLGKDTLLYFNDFQQKMTPFVSAFGF